MAPIHLCLHLWSDGVGNPERLSYLLETSLVSVGADELVLSAQINFLPRRGCIEAVHATKPWARLGLVGDDPQVSARPHGPEVLILRLLRLVHPHPRIRRVQLKVESRRFYCLLFRVREARKAVGESVRDAKGLHLRSNSTA